MKKPLASITFPGQKTVLAALLAGLTLPALAAVASPPPANHVVISQIYGGGGNSGASTGTAQFKNDFVELFNPTAVAVDLTGWTIQYGSATSEGNWSGKAGLSGSIGPGKYLLVKMAGGAAGVELPEPTLAPTGPINMSNTAGKIALVSSAVTRMGITPQSTDLVDFVGWGTANASETSPAPAPSGATSNTRSMVRNSSCTDVDNNSTEFSVIAPAPRNGGTDAVSCGAPQPPATQPIVPSCNAFSVQQGVGGSGVQSATDGDSIVNGATISSGAVAGITLGAFSASGSNGQPGSVSLNVASNVAAGNYGIGITFTNDGGQSGSCSVSVTVQGAPVAFHTIMDIQGSVGTSQYANTEQITEGVITMKLPGTDGFYIQDASGDGNPDTPDGILVFGTATTALEGDLVRVQGIVTEYVPVAGSPRSYTEFKNSTVTKLSTASKITAANISMPTDLSKYESMLVRIVNPMIINDTTSLTGYGELSLSSKRLEKPTNRYPAGSSEALNMAAENARDQLVLTDLTSVKPTVTTLPYFDYTEGTLRVGDSFADLVGVIEIANVGGGMTGFRLQPLGTPTVTHSNPRTTAPDLPTGNVRVASANVLNFFTTFGNGADVFGRTGQTCTLGSQSSASQCRGADNLAEFERQRDKIVDELEGLNADVVGLMEIQNNGDVAVSYLVSQLNAKVGLGTYDFVPGTPNPGTDAIKVAMIYKPAVLTRVGAPLSDSAFVKDTSVPIFERSPLAQTFKATNGAVFSVIVNHLKSKICPDLTAADYAANVDKGDGQGCYNDKRKGQAKELADIFVPAVIKAAKDPDVLLIGDFNSHGFEDPINILTASGLVNELERFVRPNGVVYSYLFDGESAYLDHALATPSLDGQMAGATEWHINADEPKFIDYNKEGAFSTLYKRNAYRASDHDPVVVSLNLAATFSDVSASFMVSSGSFTVNRANGQYNGTLTITNSGPTAISGPINVELSGLPAGVTLLNQSGLHNGVPYVTMSTAPVAPGASVKVPLQFSNPGKVSFNYKTTVQSGNF